MARVHCPDCEMAVIVDPSGICPEGHLIGNAGRRIELAIGDHTPHPDEPEPWSAVIEAAEAIESDGEPDAPRAIRPISIAGQGDDVEEEQANDDLMRELHALSDLDARTEERAATGPTTPETFPPPTGQETSPDDPSHRHPEPAAVPLEEPEVYRSPVAEELTDTPAQLPASTERPQRSDEDLVAIAELAALFDEPAGTPDATEAEPPEPTAAAESAESTPEATDEHLASVSHLPYVSTEPSGGAPATPERDTTRASGEAFDWSHFTAKGKRRRFGR